MGMCNPKAIRNGKAWADVVNKKRHVPASCSQPGCVHGVQYKILATGKEICSLCARLLDKEKLVLLTKANH
jgi:hypothetical protein